MPDGSATTTVDACLLVIAKEPLPGRVKTRLTPPLRPVDAAALAEASLTDTLIAVSRTPVARRLLVLDGEPGDWLPDGVDVVAQRGGGLDERLAHAFDDAAAGAPDQPLLLIGMDTPQVTATLLTGALTTLCAAGVDAVLGAATDGGWWALGLRRADAQLLRGVPLSTEDTGARQRERLTDAGLSVRDLPVLRDVDTVADAAAVAREAPTTRFATVLAELAGAPVPT